LEVAALADVKRALKDPTVPVEAFMVGEAKDTVLEGMAASLSKSRQALADLETKFNAPAPNLREQRQQVEAQQAAIKSYVAGRLQRAQQNLGTLNGVIGQFEQRLRTVPGAELGLTQLERESEVYSTLYSYLLKRQQQAAMIKASTVSKNRVLDIPQAPDREDTPKLLLRLASAPLGLLIGALGVVLAGIWSITFQSESELRRLAGATPVLGRLPTRRRMQKRKPVTLANFDFPDEDRDPEWIEACRTLRANLYRMCESNDHAVVLVTSPAEGDGKTACALSLAELVAADGKAVLVIEADLRSPRADQDQFEGAPDLLDVLQGSASWREAVRLVPSPLGEFHVLQANDTARPELLSGKAMRELLREARAQYDFVILDVPSYPLTSDALVLSAYAQCVLSVVRLRRTPRRVTLQHLRELIRNVPHGLVLNDVDPATLGQVKHAAPTRSALAPRPNRLSQVAAEYLVVSPEGGTGSSR
ncbi:MAG: GNVR domain-containing protein, partial [Myxococcales bacterium]